MQISLTKKPICWDTATIGELEQLSKDVSAIMQYDLTQARKSLAEQENYLRKLAIVIEAKKICKSV